MLVFEQGNLFDPLGALHVINLLLLGLESDLEKSCMLSQGKNNSVHFGFYPGTAPNVLR